MVDLAAHLYVFEVCTIHALVRLIWGEGQASPYIVFLSRSVYSLTKHSCPYAQSPRPKHQHKGHKGLIDLISLVEPGQISFNDDVQVSRSIIGDPTLTSNEAQHNLSCSRAQKSLIWSFYHHTVSNHYWRKEIGLISKHCSQMYTKSVGIFWRLCRLIVSSKILCFGQPDVNWKMTAVLHNF